MYLEGQSLKTQVATFMLSDVVILTHGAAAGNIAFMSLVRARQNLTKLAQVYIHNRLHVFGVSTAPSRQLAVMLDHDAGCGRDRARLMLSLAIGCPGMYDISRALSCLGSQ